MSSGSMHSCIFCPRSTFFLEVLNICLALSRAALLGVGWWGGLSSHIFTDVSNVVGIWPIAGLFIFSRWVYNTLDFWKSIKVCALYMRIPFFDCLCLTFSGGGSEVVGGFFLNLRARLWVPTPDPLGGIFSWCCVANFLTACMAEFLRALASPLVPCFIGGYTKFSEGLFRYCKKCPRKSYLCLLFLSFHDGEGIDGRSSLLSEEI